MSSSDPLLGGKSVDAMLRLVWRLPSALTGKKTVSGLVFVCLFLPVRKKNPVLVISCSSSSLSQVSSG